MLKKKMPKSAVYKQVHTPLIREDPREYSNMMVLRRSTSM